MSSERSVVHATFSVERVFAAPLQRVFAAWADPAEKARWFVPPPEWAAAEHALDFRVGGTEHLTVTPPDGVANVYGASYIDIVADSRIVLVYTMHVGGAKISASLATLEFFAEGESTRLVFTEQAAFLDGLDDPETRAAGTEQLMDGLARALETA